MNARYELIPKFESESDANALLYTPRAEQLKVRRTRLYDIDFEGEVENLDKFVSEVLFDPIAQNLVKNQDEVFGGSAFILDVSMKAGALDLEREAVLAHHRHFMEEGFVVKKLRIFHRFYFFGEEPHSEPFVRDLVNPAVQQYRLHINSHAS